MENIHNPPGYLIIKGWKLEKYLNSKGKTVRDFADALDIEMKEAYRILSGGKVGLEIARRLINYYGAGQARKYIDWEAMGIKDPCHIDVNLSEQPRF